MLSSFLLAVSISSSNAAVVNYDCTDMPDGFGGSSGVACSFQYSFNLVGTVELNAQGFDIAPSSFPVFGNLTQSGWYEEDFSAGSITGETTTALSLGLGDSLSVDPASTIQYSMSRVDTLFDYNTEIGSVNESLSNTAYLIANPTSWLVETDGVNLLLEINGAGLLLTAPAAGLPDFLATVKVSAVPVPAAIWLFASGLLGLVGFAKIKSA